MTKQHDLRKLTFIEGNLEDPLYHSKINTKANSDITNLGPMRDKIMDLISVDIKHITNYIKGIIETIKTEIDK